MPEPNAGRADRWAHCEVRGAPYYITRVILLTRFACGEDSQLAHALADAGVKVGDRVATFMWNGARHLECYHAIACMGAVVHTLNIRLSDADLEYIINHAEDLVIVADADVLPKLRGW